MERFSSSVFHTRMPGMTHTIKAGESASGCGGRLIFWRGHSGYALWCIDIKFYLEMLSHVYLKGMIRTCACIAHLMCACNVATPCASLLCLFCVYLCWPNIHRGRRPVLRPATPTQRSPSAEPISLPPSDPPQLPPRRLPSLSQLRTLSP